jgi:hypothetical protein
MLLDNVVDVADGTAHKEGKDECNLVVAVRPKVNVDASENGEQWETPTNTVNDSALAAGEELVDDIAEKEEMDESPDAECPAGWGEVGFLASVVATIRIGNRVGV